MKDYYEEKWLEYHQQTFFIDPSSFLSPLQERLPLGATVLDVGCGSGRDILWMKANGFNVTGLERSANMASLARSNTGCEIIQSDFLHFDFSIFRFDAVMMIGALVHIPHQNMPSILERICVCVRPGGFALITLKEGIGTKMDTVGRVFYLWKDADCLEMFAHLQLYTVTFHRQVSKINREDIWLTYVLKRNPAGVGPT